MMKPFSKRLGAAVTAPVPFFAVVAFCAVSAVAGHQFFKSDNGKQGDASAQPKYLIAERSTVILQYALSHPNESADQLQSHVTAPMLNVMQKYVDQGYIILEASHDENNNYVVAGLPAGVRNITKELAAAIDQAEIEAKKKEEGSNAK